MTIEHAQSDRLLNEENTSPKSLLQQIFFARHRVYRLAGPTPVQSLPHPRGGSFLLKREDLSPIHSYKWRGAMNRIALMVEDGDTRPIVAASAGNHGQGIAIAARSLRRTATVFMPRSTPALKVREVRRLGGSSVDVVLDGDSVDDAAALATEHALRMSSVIVPPFDDVHVIAGQGTIGDEIAALPEPPHTVYLQVGGGGMAAGVACVLRACLPQVRIVAVEGEGQASMGAAVRAGHPVRLDHLDRFCDGTAVRTTGKLTHALCSQLIDEFVTVSNGEVCGAIRYLWETCRAVVEPAGAMGVAALLRETESDTITGSLAIVSGANMDFGMLARIARQIPAGPTVRRHFEFDIAERRGSLVDLLDLFGRDVNIFDFQYGKTGTMRATPVLGLEGGAEALHQTTKSLAAAGVSFREVTGRESVAYRVIPTRPELYDRPLFAILDFPDRAGALRDFMKTMSRRTNICFFNYETSGETEGHALMGFEFDSDADRAAFGHSLQHCGVTSKVIHSLFH